MARVRLVAALVVVLLFAVPALARADSCQGAGDCQYQDPFGNSAPQSKPKPKPKTNTTTPAPTTTPTQQTPTQSSPVTQAQSSPTTTSSPAQTGDATGELPRTGLDLRLLGGLGVLLVGAGALVRRWLG